MDIVLVFWVAAVVISLFVPLVCLFFSWRISDNRDLNFKLLLRMENHAIGRIEDDPNVDAGERRARWRALYELAAEHEPARALIRSSLGSRLASWPRVRLVIHFTFHVLPSLLLVTMVVQKAVELGWVSPLFATLSPCIGNASGFVVGTIVMWVTYHNDRSLTEPYWRGLRDLWTTWRPVE